MLIIPAIDLKDGQCVRLRQGEMDQVTVFSEDPAAMAQHWVDCGARRIHLVDLNGAVLGRPANESAVAAIAEAVNGRALLQLGGGIRNMETIERYLAVGITSVIIGTAAIRDPEFLKQACRAFPGRIFVGLDARDGRIAISGWEETTDIDALKFAKDCEAVGASAIIYTDISRDGMLSGVNVEATVRLARAVSIPVIASGGVATLADVNALCGTGQANLAGAITGRAIYEGTLDVREAFNVANVCQTDDDILLQVY